VIYAQDTVVGLLGLAYPVLPLYSWMELELIAVEIDGQHTVNHAEKEELATKEFSKMVRGVFLPMAENWGEWVTEFHVVLVALEEVLPHFAEDKGA
jgi:hypothetical protein